jgi:hypothetical protein
MNRSRFLYSKWLWLDDESVLRWGTFSAWSSIIFAIVCAVFTVIVQVKLSEVNLALSRSYTEAAARVSNEEAARLESFKNCIRQSEKTSAAETCSGLKPSSAGAAFRLKSAAELFAAFPSYIVAWIGFIMTVTFLGYGVLILRIMYDVTRKTLS